MKHKARKHVHKVHAHIAPIVLAILNFEHFDKIVTVFVALDLLHHYAGVIRILS